MEFMITVKSSPECHDLITSAINLEMMTFRVNFGRRTIQENLRLISQINEISNGKAKIFVDLPGNKARTGNIPGAELYLKKGERLTLSLTEPSAEIDLGTMTFGLSRPELFGNVKTGSSVSFRDGAAIAQITEATPEKITCVVTRPGVICTSCGVVPVEGYVEYKTLSDIDVIILGMIPEYVFGINVSFADSAIIIRQVKSICRFDHINIIAKIESKIAVDNLIGINEASDGLILARGDLGNFYDEQSVINIAHKIVELRPFQAGPIIFATNYFTEPAKGLALSTSEQATIQEAFKLGVNTILVNETSSSQHWRQVLIAASNFKLNSLESSGLEC
ncbi:MULTISPECIES: pyruvate kinase [Rhizobium/Agrobacterium group]|nr:pyruvate kinase [Agrobacterium tumefaciens]AAS02142.1 probable pyruvate kinase [Agrobacterium radiobacter]ACM31480.1 Possible pyruvate kinase activity [Rhizobium rhizogenes K84]UXS56411.1 pyruvate kinase [Agrobacterium tumefaciens]UXS66755.1 pyruvate kinase [Agrobacterium tumefaciens]UXT85495.1 pyruvate kinase [Agrobacterium tumefaciens]